MTNVKHKEAKDIYDLAIIGGGPAAVAAGVYASRKRLKTIFITKDFNGQSQVSDGIENWIGTIKISGPDLSKALKTHLMAYAGDIVTVKEGETCQLITKQDIDSDDVRKLSLPPEQNYIFNIKTNKSDATETLYHTKTVLIATGSTRRTLDIPGAKEFEHKGLTYCATCDGPLFSGQNVVVVGGGNAAFESAAQLLAYCSSVTLLNRSDSYRADPVTVSKVLANPHMKSITNAMPKMVHGGKFVNGLTYTNTKTAEDIKLDVAGIFVEIGSIPTTYFAKDLVGMNPVGNITVDPRTQSTTLHGIWAAGDCTDGLYHQNNIAAGDAVKALEDIYSYLKA